MTSFRNDNNVSCSFVLWSLESQPTNLLHLIFRTHLPSSFIAMTTATMITMLRIKNEMQKMLVDNMCHQLDAFFVNLLDMLDEEVSIEAKPEIEIASDEQSADGSNLDRSTLSTSLYGFAYVRNRPIRYNKKPRQYRTISLSSDFVRCPLPWCDTYFHRR